MIHSDHTYCIPNRYIFDNLFLALDIITTAAYHNVNLGLLSLDQAFDRVDHGFLFRTLEAFAFGPAFIGLIKLLC